MPRQISSPFNTAGRMSFFTDVIQRSPLLTTTTPVQSLDMLEPETRRRVLALIADAHTKGIELMVFETFRSKERQLLLYQQKVTKLKDVGVHHYGLACDIVRSVDGHPSWKGDFSFMRALARRNRLVWGGDWGRPDVPTKFPDGYHVQRCTVARQGKLFAGTWYPDDAYNPYDEL